MSADYDRWKREIDLAAYAARAFGFRVNRAKSSQRQQVLHRPGSDEVIVVGRDRTDGHWWYFNPHDPADKGSIIDFVLRRRGEDWEVMLAELGGLPRQEAAPLPPVGFDLPPLQALHDRRFLHARGLGDATLDQPAFVGRIFNETLPGPGGHLFTYTCFPLYNAQGEIVGLERRNQGFKAQAAHSQRGQGLWMSRWDSPPAEVLVTESPLDALAYQQLHPHPARACLSTAGALAEGQVALLGHWFEVLAPARWVLGADRDPAGQAQNLYLAAALPGPGRASRYQGRLARLGTALRLRLHIAHAPGETLWTDAAQALLQALAPVAPPQPAPGGTCLDWTLPWAPDPLHQAAIHLLHLRGLDDQIRLARPRHKDWNEDLLRQG